jgi:rhamnose utilization protein RhaD (predicted bifunctional aldolase and dehydrogenase)
MTVQEQVIRYSTEVGSDPMLIQGAGGNASWKDGTTLWIKASGTWLSDAAQKDIFVPIDIPQTLALIDSGASDLSAARIGDSPLRPSIETCLHALLPQKFVIHFHAVDVIAHAALRDGRKVLGQRLQGLDWAWVDYVKPGPDLARAVTASIGPAKAPEILVLGNHGLVIAAPTLEHLDHLLKDVLARCAIPPRIPPTAPLEQLASLVAQWDGMGYTLPEDQRCHALALDAICLQLAGTAWVLYPDHAVFLGAHATIVDTPWASGRTGPAPECVIVPGRGVLLRKDLSAGQLAMLSCYVDVTLRLDSTEDVAALNHSDIAELLNWDAEKYRQSLNAV